ncbi:hypothetical protein NDU88_000307 [Pleurodeles waltl]|uniref:Uncharacterized protein n=1 Tax=Pleurodeles waltl TaxID=8319 RepID=A0AAV7S761_PLEWA|nr:hypothetical protein NDU88_000307 [Pleurodeles waltl]
MTEREDARRRCEAKRKTDGREDTEGRREARRRPLRRRGKASAAEGEPTAVRPTKLGAIRKRPRRGARRGKEPRHPPGLRTDVTSSSTVPVAGYVFPFLKKAGEEVEKTDGDHRSQGVWHRVS